LSEIKKEKLGFKEKLMVSLGKRLMWIKERKANKLLYHLGFIYTLHELNKEFGDFDKTLDIMKRIGREGGNDIIFENFEMTKRIMSKSIKDLKYILEAAWYVLLGKEKINYFEYIPPDENGVEKIRWRYKTCLFCSGIENDEIIGSDIEKYRRPLASLMEGSLESTFKSIMEFAGRKFDVKVVETKCIARGDPYQEFEATFIPIKD